MSTTDFIKKQWCQLGVFRCNLGSQRFRCRLMVVSGDREECDRPGTFRYSWLLADLGSALLGSKQGIITGLIEG
ncbi:MAG TPA: hypothetical protein DCX60_08960 [Phycisphaerales bacterium]|nr:hypothetical protein [Phycisphaerales bacterium]